MIDWKCLRCGEVYHSSSYPDYVKGLERITKAEVYINCDPHECEDGGLGIGELIGSTPDPKTGSVI